MKINAIDKPNRVIIDSIQPQVDHGVIPVKRVVGDVVEVQADIFIEGHGQISADVIYRHHTEKRWHTVAMEHVGNDLWSSHFKVAKRGIYEFKIAAWPNFFLTWSEDFKKRYQAFQELEVDLQIGIDFLTTNQNKLPSDAQKLIQGHLKRISAQKKTVDKAHYIIQSSLAEMTRNLVDDQDKFISDQTYLIDVDRKKASFSTWYEFFPRSAGEGLKHGTFKDCRRKLPEIHNMGFDVIYLPPIHPIGEIKRKGKNNNPQSSAGDVGSPWAIGNKVGGHKAIHPELGTLADFHDLIKDAKSLGIDIALDIAFQCAPDHPYVKDHPNWFTWRPDGTVQHAENPPKKYEDVLPINFETDDWQALWNELKSVFEYWIEQGIHIFRVDNPHTKPFPFWEWLIETIKKSHPDTIFLAEAFTRPKVMRHLAKIGFTQSYTYFTWRTTKEDFISYMTELTQTDLRDVFRPNFWPNTPDILAYHLQSGSRPMFIQRLILAATLSSSYGIYGPPFELCINQAVNGKEEYLFSEKYEIKDWDWDKTGHLKDLIAILNRARQEHPALQDTYNIRFCETDNPQVLAYVKETFDHSNQILCVVNLDPENTQSAMLRFPLKTLKLKTDKEYKLVDLIAKDDYTWHGEWNYVELNPFVMPAHIFQILQSS